MTTLTLSERDREEIRRSAEEAQRVILRSVDIERYLGPHPDTPYPLEYAFHLLGDVRGKAVLDLGCGTGENIVSLSMCGARVTGIDISPELLSLAEQRLKNSRTNAVLKVASAYNTGLPDHSVDVIFCIALIHHLNIAGVRNEMLRILRPNGTIVLSEPIRFSGFYNYIRNLLPPRDGISEHEHPLTEHEFDSLTKDFNVEGLRYFRLPFLPFADWVLPFDALDVPFFWKLDRWILRRLSPLRRYATVTTMRLRRAERNDV